MPGLRDVSSNAQDIDTKSILAALIALRKGDASVRLPADWTGVGGKIADVFNEIAELNGRTSRELERLSRVVGREGKLNQRGSIGDVEGFWRDSLDSVNAVIEDLVHPISETARVIGAVAQGDLSKSVDQEIDGRPLQGEFLRTAKTINKMVEQLGSFASEVTRVAREVGTEGNLGGQADVKGVAGTWKDLTDSVNSMAGNLTSQVRNIADVTKAVATGNLSRKITVDVKGEMLELKDTINTMVDQLSSIADQAEPRRAIPVGHEDKNIFDTDDALAKCYGNREMMSRMIAFFLTDSTDLLAKMRTALRNRDTEEIANAAHRLRGTVLYLGAKAAVDAAKRTEQTGRSGDLAAAATAVEQLEDEIRLLAEAIVASGEGQDDEDPMVLSSPLAR